jgi:hypothetical protein
MVVSRKTTDEYQYHISEGNLNLYILISGGLWQNERGNRVELFD